MRLHKRVLFFFLILVTGLWLPFVSSGQDPQLPKDSLQLPIPEDSITTRLNQSERLLNNLKKL